MSHGPLAEPSRAPTTASSGMVIWLSKVARCCTKLEYVKYFRALVCASWEAFVAFYADPEAIINTS